MPPELTGDSDFFGLLPTEEDFETFLPDFTEERPVREDVSVTGTTFEDGADAGFCTDLAGCEAAFRLFGMI